MKRLTINGDELIDMRCGYIPAVRQIQDMNLALQAQCAKNVWGDRHLFPSISGKLHEVLTVGVVPEFYGRIPEHVGGGGLPHKAQQTEQIAGKL